MRATTTMLAKGFFGRSAQEFGRLAGVAWKLEGVKGAQGPRQLYNWQDNTVVRDSVLMSDNIIGGLSQSHLDFVSSKATADSSDLNSNRPSYARFHGTISTALPPDNPRVQRTGYAGFRTPDQHPTIFGRSFWDIDPYQYLALRVKSDGRAYLVNIQTDSVEPHDLHQHRLFAKRPGQWETVLIKWNHFVRTNYGFVVEPAEPLMRQKVRTVGIGLTDRVEGPFELCIERIWATNDVRDADDSEVSPAAEVEDGKSAEQGVPGEQGLKNRKGQRIHW